MATNSGQVTDAVRCGDPFHDDGCPGGAGGDHELREPVEVWCFRCDRQAIFGVRQRPGIASYCALHGLEVQAEMMAPVPKIQVLTGIEQYQAEGR